MNKLILFIGSLLCPVFLLAQAPTLTDGEYFIKINQTGKYLAIAGGANNNGSRLIQWDNEYARHFMFIIQHLGNNVYSLKAKHSGKYLSTEGTPARGAKIIQWDWLDQDNQKWYILPHKSGKGAVLSCYQNRQQVIMQYWNSLVTPQNGAYFFLNDEIAMPAMILTFKKNEAAQAATPVWKGKGKKPFVSTQ